MKLNIELPDEVVKACVQYQKGRTIEEMVLQDYFIGNILRAWEHEQGKREEDRLREQLQAAHMQIAELKRVQVAPVVESTTIVTPAPPIMFMASSTPEPEKGMIRRAIDGMINFFKGEG